MTTTGLNLLDNTQTLGFAAETIPSAGPANDLTIFTTLTITDEDGDRRGWADLKITEADLQGEAKFGFDAAQARLLARYLYQVAVELEARTLKAAA